MFWVDPQPEATNVLPGYPSSHPELWAIGRNSCICKILWAFVNPPKSSLTMSCWLPLCASTRLLETARLFLQIYVHGECARAVKSDSEAFERFLKTIYDCHAPIVVYVVKSPDLTQQNVTDLKFLKKFLKNSHVLLWHRNNEKRAKAARSSGDLSLFCPSCALNDPATAAAGVVVSATNRRKCDRGIAPLTAEQRSVVCNGSAPESALIAGGGGGRLLKQMEGLGFALCEDPHDGSFCELCANAQDYPESQQSGDYAQCFLHNCLCPAFQTPSNAVALIKTVAQQRLANAASALHRWDVLLKQEGNAKLSSRIFQRKREPRYCADFFSEHAVARNLEK